MKCDANGAWIFHECASSSTACYGSAVDVGGKTNNPTGSGDSKSGDRDNSQANRHKIDAPGKKADSIDLVTTGGGEGEQQGGYANIFAFIVAILLALS